MDSHKIVGYNVTGADSSYISSQHTSSPIPNRIIGPLKFSFRNSPSSPFSPPFDCDTVTALSDSREQHSSSESLSGKSPSCNSSLETTSYCQRLNSSPSEDSHQTAVLRTSSGTLFSHKTDYEVNIRRVLQELETVLMGDEAVGGGSRQPQIPSQRLGSWNREPQGSLGAQAQSSSASGERRSEEGGQSEKRHKAVEEEIQQLKIPSGNLKELLIECARALSENRIDDFEKLVEQARGEVSISGQPIQRLGAYMIEGLVARRQSSGNNIYRALRCKEPLGKDLLSYMHILYEMCPYLKFGYMAANGAIAEACRNENRIHIVDFQIAQGTQWLTLLQALAARPGGAPYVRITGIDDPVSQYARGASLEAVGKRLAALSEKYNIPVEFHAVPVFLPDVTREMLDVRAGEALAVNFPLQLHHTPDESVDVNNPRDGLLRMVKSLAPKVTTLVEQESNTNTTPFLTRFTEALNYYSAMFESIDVTMPRDRKERISVEQHCLAKDIVNVISCEGKERVERHELFGKWKSRFTMAGFQQYPLSSYVNSVIRGLLRCYSKHYTLVEKDGAMLLGWKDRMLISASAWH
ncbi:chitin-inducible gibberellin-responsive protein 1-like [Chenopodium quinoa]|uniref:chitin-inducible gibberellin-responsive protein 1-like n=1 Tax=Chenopodium quinoa TaxID=63459 RepID=UPI000B799C53|nr:chitin-inducible gibberellin-responsive protein 1-like [Chenopodium quinoa]XP_021754786.1 chitin-inducible gibberellin-responsive protein 1-like [Chenopodium quinoa]XP_021754787.1 chitin-inducible gibberellin-responsive protein 1-like [Chenopodium quinoa]